VLFNTAHLELKSDKGLALW